MTYRSRLSRTLIQQSMRVLLVNKRFFLFALFASVICLLLLAIALTPIHYYEAQLFPLTKAKLHHFLWLYLLLMIFLYCTHLVIFFFSMALTACTIQYFKGDSASISYGFRSAKHSFWRMYCWVTFAATIGFFIFVFQGFLKRFKWMQDYLIESNWNIATYLITPVLVIENLSINKTFRRSADLIYQEWGLSVKPNFGSVSYILLAKLIALIPLIISFFIGGLVNITIGAFITAILYLLITSLSMSVNTVLKSAIYLYASEKIIPPHFDKSLANAFVYAET